jgi:transcriptional regulator with XRE-family HTH domain
VTLTPERVSLLAGLLYAGRSRTEIAAALGVSPRTVSRWRTDPSVLAELERLRNATPVTQALAVLEDIALHGENERNRLQAAQTLLRLAI